MSYYDGVVGEESVSDNIGQAISSPAVASNRDLPIASASSHNQTAKPKKWQPQSSNLPRYLTL